MFVVAIVEALKASNPTQQEVQSAHLVQLRDLTASINFAVSLKYNIIISE